MKLKVDLARCVGHGRCYDLAPDVFDEDAHGHCALLQPDVPPEHQEAARAAVENCPEGAISIVE